MIEEWTQEFSNYSPVRLSRAFKEWRACSEYFPTIKNIRDLLNTDKRNPAPGFAACKKNGCIDGWRPTGPGKWDGYQRCQCRIDWIESVKATGLAVDMESIRRAEDRENWKQIEIYKREHGGLTPQQIWLRDHKDELGALVSKMSIKSGPHPKAKELLELRKKGITGQKAYKMLDSSPTGAPYAEYKWQREIE